MRHPTSGVTVNSTAVVSDLQADGGATCSIPTDTDIDPDSCLTRSGAGFPAIDAQTADTRPLDAEQG